MRHAALFVTLAVAAAAGCDAGTIKLIGADFCTMSPTAPPAELGYDAFYEKYLDGDGIPVLSSGAVDDAAVVSACQIVVHMVGFRNDIRTAMVRQNMSVAVIGRDEVTTDIPEYRNLNSMFPQQDWNRLRGVGATLMIPVSSVGEENLLCLAGDFFAGEKLLVQTFASSHAVPLGATVTEHILRASLQMPTWQLLLGGAHILGVPVHLPAWH